MTLWHFLEEDNGAGRCYLGTIKAIRVSNCIVEYDRAERLPGPHSRGSSWGGRGGYTAVEESGSASTWVGTRGGGGWRCPRKGGDRALGGGIGGRGGRGRGGEREWTGFRAFACEEVEPFRVTLPRSQLSTLVINGKSPAAAKLAAHGVVCEVSACATQILSSSSDGFRIPRLSVRGRRRFG